MGILLVPPVLKYVVSCIIGQQALAQRDGRASTGIERSSTTPRFYTLIGNIVNIPIVSGRNMGRNGSGWRCTVVAVTF